MINQDIIKSIAKEYGTPSYIFDIDVLQERMNALRQILGDKVNLCYAMKANPFLVDAMKTMADKFEVCSPGEFAICEYEQVDLSRIVLSGVNKERHDIVHVMKDLNGVGTYTVESVNQLKLINSCAAEYNLKAKVLLRVTSGNQFGLNEEDIYKIIENREEYSSVIFDGIQCYSGTQKKKMSQIEKEINWLNDICVRCETEYGCKLNEIEYGPGLPINYFGEEADNNGYETVEEFSALLDVIRGRYDITLEMGRFMAATCGMFITRIADMKMNAGQRYLMIDGGINHINYYGQAMAMKIPKTDYIRMEYDETYGDGVNHQVEEYSKGVQPYNICGSLCTVGDVIVKNLMLEDAKVGDMLVFYNIGAYSVTEGIYLFLSRQMPSIISYSSDNNAKLLRDPLYTWEINSCKK